MESQGWAPVDGAELYYCSVGEGLPLIVIHGGPDFDHHYLRPDMDCLADRYRLIYYDQRGRGQSRGEVDLATLDIWTYVEDLDRLRKHLGLDRVAILGHSWGALVAMHYAIGHPAHLSHMVLLNPAPATHEDVVASREVRIKRREPYGKQIDALEAGFERGDPEAVAAFYAIEFGTGFKRPEDARRLDFGGTREQTLSGRAIEDRLMEGLIWSPGFTLVPELAKVRTPTLVLHGDLDFFRVEGSERLARAIPDARLEVLKDSGHFSFIDAGEELRSALHPFLSSR